MTFVKEDEITTMGAAEIARRARDTTMAFLQIYPEAG